MIRNSRQMTAKFYKDWKSDYVELQNKYNTLKESVLGVEELEKELEWWHNLISKHHDNKTCPNLKTYVENLQKENEALKQSQELVCYSCGEPIKYDSDRPECYCNDCIPMDKQSQGKVLSVEEIKKAIWYEAYLSYQQGQVTKECLCSGIATAIHKAQKEIVKQSANNAHCKGGE